MAGLAFENSNLTDLPPIENEILEGAPSSTWRDLRNPKLRRFPRHGAEITWLDFLGHGIAGLVFKVTIGGGDPVALKIFWRARRPKPRPRPNDDGFIQDEWPFEDECRNVALLEKLKWIITTADADRRPLPILRRPKTAHDIAANLRGFSDEARDSPRPTRPPDDPIPMPPVPALTECYGWTTVRRDAIPRVSPPVSDYVDADIDWHWALVYELVPGAPQDLAVGQAHLDFFYAMGFAMEAYKPDNWRGGRLVDFNDVSAPFSTGWRLSAVAVRDARAWFWTLGFEDERRVKRRIVTGVGGRAVRRTGREGGSVPASVAVDNIQGAGKFKA
ncbi:uncharacterized protein THITE_2112159 [Thermothielavioides terrestris NRRL 8126]|uniref:Protein kinase domain-containing protein n=1 Tax=Thermothielavioides terrestris (strain ATCC 38088 / NRRL 8126) TaxID=578455 RepID=G2R526_THETT|nr:uncharacterized protein THITE_2112159 [Thermothielavioides terrestris NRRL 8126]AEO65303.1 hypothetical protein THITE_2112159 [Thermothielavioides terrestris NRRL 8126]